MTTENSSAGAPTPLVPKGANPSETELGAPSAISQADYENLREHALVLVRMNGAKGPVEVRAVVERAPLDGSCYVRLGHGADDVVYFPRVSGVHTYYEFGDSEFVPREAIIREVKLREWRAIHADKNFDVLAYAAHAYRWLWATMPSGELASETSYLLSEKIHKFKDYAWLGGCDGLEAAHA